MNQSSNTISKGFIVTVNGSCVTLHPSHRHINKISLQQSQLSGKFKLLKSTRLFKFKKKTHRNHCSDGLCLEMKSFFVFVFPLSKYVCDNTENDHCHLTISYTWLWG